MSNLTYKLATLGDFEDFYRIKCDKVNIAWSGFTQAPEKNLSMNGINVSQHLTTVGYILYTKDRNVVPFSMLTNLRMVILKLHHLVFYLISWGKVQVPMLQLCKYLKYSQLQQGRLCRGCQTRTLLPISGMRNWASSEWMSSKLEIYHFLEASINFING